MTGFRDVRGDFPILQRQVNGRRLVYLDSAATTQRPIQVLEAMDSFYREHNANVHRGAYGLAEEATGLYEGARAKVARFIGAASPREVIFSRGTTSALNTVAYGWGLNRLRAGDRILLTTMEHHANVVPWQMVCRHTGAELVYLPFDPDYRVDLSALPGLLDERVKVVGVTGMSNVLGTIPPVAQVAAAARAVGAITVVDGAQMVPHVPTDVGALGADFIAFSAHKMLGPTGVGALWGRLELLEAMEPAEGGGEMIRDVDFHQSTWAEVPQKFEAGTPPIAEAIGLGAAVDYLSGLGMEAVHRHEVELAAYALDRLAAVPKLEVYGPAGTEDRGGVISFTLADIHPHDLATILDGRGIAIRAGHHCARPLHRVLDVPATARVSFYVYSTRDEVDALIDGLDEARRLFGVA